MSTVLVKRIKLCLESGDVEEINEQRKKMFEIIINKYYSYLKYRVSCIIPPKHTGGINYAEDISHDAITFFYTYHLNNFNMSYEIERIYTRARNYFFKRFFWYLTKKTFYGQNTRRYILKNSKVIEILLNSNTHKKYNNNQGDVEITIYLEQFRAFVRICNIKEQTKNKIMLYLNTGDNDIFNTNFHYYKAVMKDLVNRFDTIND